MMRTFRVVVSLLLASSSLAQSPAFARQSDQARAKIYFSQGNSSEDQGRFGSALRLYNMAADLDFNNEQYQDAIARVSPKVEAVGLFGSALHKHAANDLTGAISDYQAAIQLYDDDPAVHWYLGSAYRAAGKTDEADQEFAKERTMKSRGKRGIPVPFYPRGCRRAHGNGSGAGLGRGDFGSSTLYFVPGIGLTKHSPMD